MTDARKLLQKNISGLSAEERLKEFLHTTEVALRTISDKYPETSEVCQEAIRNCWAWLDRRVPAPEVLAQYLDGEASELPCMQESIFADDPNASRAFIYILLVVAHAAYLAYEFEGRQDMSEIIEGAGDYGIEDILEYGERYGLVIA